MMSAELGRFAQRSESFGYQVNLLATLLALAGLSPADVKRLLQTLATRGDQRGAGNRVGTAAGKPTHVL